MDNICNAAIDTRNLLHTSMHPETWLTCAQVLRKFVTKMCQRSKKIRGCHLQMSNPWKPSSHKKPRSHQVHVFHFGELQEMVAWCNLDVSRLLRFLSCLHQSFLQFYWLVKQFQRRLWRWLRWLYSFKVPRGKKLLEGTALKSTFFGSLERSDSFFTSSNHKTMTKKVIMVLDLGHLFVNLSRSFDRFFSLSLLLCSWNWRVTKSLPRKLPKPPRRDDAASVTASSCALPSVLEMSRSLRHCENWKLKVKVKKVKICHWKVDFFCGWKGQGSKLQKHLIAAFRVNGKSGWFPRGICRCRYDQLWPAQFVGQMMIPYPVKPVV